MKTLVLGHGRLYGNDVRCSPIPLVDWINDEYVSVDCNEDVKPDIVYDLSHRPWTFAQESEYDRIIDTCGCMRLPMDEVMRILKPCGIYYGRRGPITKQSIHI